MLAPLNCQFPLFPDIAIDKYSMGRKRQADVPVPEQRPPATVDDHDGQHDADKDGVEDDDEEQDVCLAKSVVYDEFTQTSEKKEITKGRKEEKMCHLEVILQSL